jgi:hypothetical protein
MEMNQAMKGEIPPDVVSLTAAKSGDGSYMPLHGTGANMEHPTNRGYWRALFAGQVMSSLVSGLDCDDVKSEQVAEVAIECADALILRLRMDAAEFKAIKKHQ